ncbi:MAG TPA: diacylglycerol kinase family protein [Anaeromyxobacteraceae bacterium]|nr:diacylglycerol kinase family protein [Anaeromyxobacteraceae bacterium]
MRPFLIVNPASANGRTGRHFDAIARAVRGALGEFEALFTTCRGDGARLAREAVGAGGDLVVAVGGDGTASEVIDGIAAAPGRDVAQFGFIPRGTGSDFRRSVGLPADVGGAARALANPRTSRIDLGRITYLGHDGRPQVRHFANVAGCGVAGLVVRKVEQGTKAFGGKVSFMIASARALLEYQDQPVRWRADGGPWTEQRITSLSVCNGRWFGGGMLVAPEARIDDGQFDVVIWSGLGLRDFITKKRMLYDGTHVRLPNTRVLRAREVEVEPVGGAQVLLDVDGEQPGMLPARFTLLPGALEVRAA